MIPLPPHCILYGYRMGEGVVFKTSSRVGGGDSLQPLLGLPEPSYNDAPWSCHSSLPFLGLASSGQDPAVAMVPLPLLGKGRKHHLDYSDPKTEEIGGGVVHTQRKLALLTVQSLKFGCSSRFAPPSRTSTPQDN